GSPVAVDIHVPSCLERPSGLRSCGRGRAALDGPVIHGDGYACARELRRAAARGKRYARSFAEFNLREIAIRRAVLSTAQRSADSLVAAMLVSHGPASVADGSGPCVPNRDGIARGVDIDREVVVRRIEAPNVDLLMILE